MSEIDFLTQHRVQDMMREAAQERLAKAAHTNAHTRLQILNRLITWIGEMRQQPVADVQPEPSLCACYSGA